jgi:hypothetical protein
MLQKPEEQACYAPYLLHHSFAPGFCAFRRFLRGGKGKVQKQGLLNRWCKTIKRRL